MTDAMFDLPGRKEVKHYTIDKVYAKSKLEGSMLEVLKAAA
jgi:ATP-dependent Clp protease ATP-binding subunit ClpX